MLENGLHTESLEALTALGLTSLEAEIYAHLLRSEALTGYAIAKALAKPTANVYKAIRTLQIKGAIIVDDGETQICRAVPAPEFLDRIERGFQEDRQRAEYALEQLPAPQGDARIYQIGSVEQVYERCRKMLAAATRVVLIDAFPVSLAQLVPDLEATAARGVTVFVKVYEPTEVRGARVLQEKHADAVRKRWPANWLNLVTDGTELLLAILDGEGRSVVQAVWSESPYLSYNIYGYLAHELISTVMEEAFDTATDVASLRKTFYETYRSIPRDAPGFHRLRRLIAPDQEEPIPGVSDLNDQIARAAEGK